jgi:hypothetical protein
MVKPAARQGARFLFHSFSGQVVLARKHTAHIERDLPQLVARSVGRLGGLREAQERRFLTYRAQELTDAQVHDALIRSLDARVLPVTKVPDVLREWRQPRHAEFRAGRTAWRLFNAFTEALKGNLAELPKRTQALHGLLDAFCRVGQQEAQPDVIESPRLLPAA